MLQHAKGWPAHDGAPKQWRQSSSRLLLRPPCQQVQQSHHRQAEPATQAAGQVVILAACRWRQSGGRLRLTRWQPSQPWSAPRVNSCARRPRSGLWRPEYSPCRARCWSVVHAWRTPLLCGEQPAVRSRVTHTPSGVHCPYHSQSLQQVLHAWRTHDTRSCSEQASSSLTSGAGSSQRLRI